MYSPTMTFDGMSYRVKGHSPHLDRRKWELQLLIGRQWRREAVTTMPATTTWQEVAAYFGLDPATRS